MLWQGISIEPEWVLLVLLVIFMASLPLTQKGLDINLPAETKTAQQQQPDSSQIVLEMTADRRISVNKSDVTMADLRSRGVKFESYDSPGLKTKDGVAELGPHRVRVCWFKDPDGNILSIVERTRASEA